MKRKLTSIILTLCICLSLVPAVALPAAAADVWDGTADTAWYDGNSSATAFTISTAAQFAGLRQLVNAGTETFSGKTITLANDLDLGGILWTRIGYITASGGTTNYGRTFNGTFDGGGHTISGLNVNDTTDSYVGLFGFVRYGTIKNLSVSGTVTGASIAGGVVGEMDNIDGDTGSGTVTNCSFSGTVTGKNFAGGVVGEATLGAKVEYCYNSGTVVCTGSNKMEYGAGGVVGSNRGTVQYCYNTGDVSGDGYIGGVASVSSNMVQFCYNTGKVTATGRSGAAGGVVGWNFSNAKVEYCYSTGKMEYTGSGTANVGGVVGYSQGGNNGKESLCFYLRGAAEKGIGSVTADNTAKTMPLYACEFAVEDSFSSWNFFAQYNGQWQMGRNASGDPVRPILRAYPESGDTLTKLACTCVRDPDGECTDCGIENCPCTGAVTSYSIAIDGGTANGTVTADKTEAEAGDTVTLTVTPAAGYELKSLTVTDESGSTVDVTPSGDAYTFTMPAGDVTVTAVFEHKHVWDTWGSSDTHHWHECTGEGVCDITADAEKDGYGEHTPGNWIVDQAATADAEGSRHKECTDCGRVLETGTIPRLDPDHAHAWATAWTANETHHWHECGAEGCGVTADADKDGYGEHTPSDWIVDQAATADAEGSRHKECTVCGQILETGTIPKLEPGHTHAWADAWAANETHHWHECEAEGCGVTADADKEGYGEHTWDGGTVTKAPTSTATGVKTYTCTVCKTTRTEEISMFSYTISGTVKDSAGNVAADVHIALKQGNKTAASPTKTDANGNYSFNNVAPGTYNIVATQIVSDGKNKIMTILVTIVNEDQFEQNITMPSDNVNSVLEVKDDGKTPDIVVGGLEAEAERQKGADDASTVTVTMTVESKGENDADRAKEIIAIKSAAAAVSSPGTKKTLEYLDIQVVKTVESGDSKTTGAISTTQSMLTIVIPFDFSDKVQNSVEVYRYHGSGVNLLTTAGNGSGERIVLGEDSITLYVNKFSTYAVGYVLKSDDTSPPAGTGGGFGGAPTYSITVPGHVTGGTVQSSLTHAMAGQIITLTVQLDAGYELDDLTATDSQGKILTLTAQDNGKFTFIMPARNVTVSVSFTEIEVDCPKDHTCPIWPFTDASPTAWYHDGVHYCIENGLMSGYGNNIFGPGRDTSRAMVAEILWRLEGRPAVSSVLPFDDVADGAWYANGVRWAAASGIVNGYGNGLFGPNDSITREQMTVLLHHYAQYKGYGTSARADLSVYADAGNIDDWAMEAMRWANAEGLIAGRTETTLVPKGTITRAEAATILMLFAVKN